MADGVGLPQSRNAKGIGWQPTLYSIIDFVGFFDPLANHFAPCFGAI